MREAGVITREELYQLVWSQPMLRVADQFEVSSSYMARVCTALNVPRPAQGYWAKREVGKAPPQEPLPNARPGDLSFWVRGGELPRLPKQIYSPTPTPPKKIRMSKEAVHPLLRDAREHFGKSRAVEDGAYLKPYKTLLLDVISSKACLEKSLGFANTLYKTLEAAGHRVLIAPPNDRFSRSAVEERETPTKRHEYNSSGLWSPYRPTLAFIGTVPIGLTLVEMSEQMLMRYIGNGKYIRDEDYIPPCRSRYDSDRTWTTTKEAPSGRLKLVAYCPYHKVSWSQEWQETVKTPLDKILSSIVKAIETAATELVAKLEEADRQAEIAHQKRLAEQERYRRQEDARRIEQSVKESRDDLAQVIQRWTQVMSVEQFLKGVEDRATGVDIDQREEILARLGEARSFLGTQNPLDFFLSWKTPTERYLPRYPQNNEATDEEE
jgi:hypothetical protein